MISVQKFRKAYGRTLAVAELSFEVNSGEILGLVGPNGAGKTTTLRAISGLIPPSTGSLSVAGHDVLKHPLEVKHRLSMVPDEPRLFSELTVDQHLAFIASAYRVEDADRKARELLTMFELAGKRNQRASDLSRGMRQKLAICCAYLHDPQAILFDEPMTGLDPKGIRLLKDSILERAGNGASVLISSHLLAMVEDICTHVLILDEGQQRYCGRIDALRELFAGDSQSASLEQIFFLATQGETSLPVTVGETLGTSRDTPAEMQEIS